MLSVRTITAWAVLIVLVGVGVAVWLLLAYTGGDADDNRVRLDAIRTAGTIVVGTGGAAALLLTARRQRSTEIALKQKDRDQALQEQVVEQTRRHQERVAAATEADAEARRITDLYTKAVEQLGSEKAPVRLGGLYALERLAQDNPGQRQTIVNVLCAYLRMPCAVPGDPPDDADDTVLAVYRERVQEREVRLTAQRLLTHHLRPGDDPDTPVDTFWANIDLDLTGAILINLDLTRCRTRTATFTEGHFTSDASFDKAQFTGYVSFDRAQFSGYALFHEAQFTGDAWFRAAQFHRGVSFREVQFTGDDVSFDEAQLTGDVSFQRAQFTGYVSFEEAQFTGDAWFRAAQFPGGVSFDKAQFISDARFREVQFPGAVSFREAQFTGTASFREVQFTGTISLDGAQFAGPVWFDGTQFPGEVPSEVARFFSPAAADAGQQLGGETETGW